MKKNFCLIISFIFTALCVCFIGCKDTRSNFIFYYANGDVFEEILVKEGTKPSEVNYKHSINYMNVYDFEGWYSFSGFDYNDGKVKSLSKFDISKDNNPIGTNSEFKYVAIMKIKETGWNYYGDNTNAFVWENGNYASPSISLRSGENYIRFDKTISTEPLKYCKVFVNGGNNNYIKNLEIFDYNGFKISDIDLSNNVWENRTQQASIVSSYILKITATTDFEAGIIIGSSID